jgi:hypothetical protein
MVLGATERGAAGFLGMRGRGECDLGIPSAVGTNYRLANDTAADFKFRAMWKENAACSL